MTVRSRLVLTFAGVALLLVLPALYAVSQLAELREIASDQRREHAAAFLALGRLQTTLAELERFQRGYVATPGPELRAGVERALERARSQLDRLEEIGYGAVAGETRALVAALADAAGRIQELVSSGQVGAATTFLNEQAGPLLARAQASLDRIARAIDRRSAAGIEEARAISTAATTTTLVAIAISLAIALVLGAWATRTLSVPLRRLTNAAETVAGGEFATPEGLPHRREDEIGDLSRSFRSMTKQLAELDRLRAEFLSMATHDLKTPINVISGYAELFDEGIYGELNEEQREAVESIREQTTVLTGLVTQLLDTSRIEAGGFQLELGDTDPAELLERVERAFRARARQQRVDFTVEADPSLPAAITADADRLHSEVLGNLLSNAFKFTPEGGEVRVRARAEDGTVRIDVSDTGAGIPPEELAHIFKKYHQASDEARAKGTGLGLAIAREVVEQHGGEIDAESEPDEGTTFHIALPVRQPERDHRDRERAARAAS